MNLCFLVAIIYCRQDSLFCKNQFEDVSLKNSDLQLQVFDLKTRLVHLQRELSQCHRKKNDTTVREDLDKLNEILDLREREIAELQSKMATFSESKVTKRKKGPTHQERMEKLKKEDPKQYAKIQERIKAFQESQAKFLEQQEGFFDRINTDGMTKEQKALLIDYQSLLQLNNTLRENKSPENMLEVYKNLRVLKQMEESVREVLFDQIGGDGFADEIREIYKLTDAYGVLKAHPPRNKK